MDLKDNFIERIRNEYQSAEMHFMSKQLKRAIETKPYAGFSILHHIPFTRETVVKLGVLYAGGAEVTVTSPSFMDVDQSLIEQFLSVGGRWKQLHEIENEVFDFHLDCAAELISRVAPKIGTVEITGTGTNKYSKIEPDYPIISVDKSKIKSLETILGTGEAFVRAFKELTKEIITDKYFMVFGYGKVGKGIVQYLSNETHNIIVIDKQDAKVLEAQFAGFEAYHADDKFNIEKLAPNMFAIVTATGYKNVISEGYDCEKFRKKYLANMGGEDEFGYQFKANEIMCKKKPINFFIERPTLMRYLDPVFYAHNQSIDVLLYSNLSNGLHAFPSFISNEVVNEWDSIFKESANL